METCEYCGKEAKTLAGLKTHYRFCKAAKETMGEEEIGDPSGFQVSKIEETVEEIPIAGKEYLDRVLSQVFREVTDCHARRAIAQARPSLEGLAPIEIRNKLLGKPEIAKLPYATRAIIEIII